MREIKFRAWDRINGMFRKQQMIKEPSLSRSDISKGCRINDIFKDDEFIWMQYTGLKDSNGVEIYDGDVVEFCDFDSLRTGGITSDKTRKAKVLFIQGGYFVKEGDYEALLYDALINDSELIIIGNIYQNKDLLEDE
ncbi:YopX family protein [Brochothrix thermosphacta]|uniref:YopX family protein n=1 Tax=Brochothrix thermosphacta TaxID=2756 RepID=UPI0039AFBBB2